MIKISFSNLSFEEGIKFLESSSRISIVVEGHAGFGKKGNDIVCSAVSVISQTMVICISKIAKVNQSLTQEDGLLKTEIDLSGISSEKRDALNIILDVFCIGIFEIEREYPDTIEISFKI